MTPVKRSCLGGQIPLPANRKTCKQRKCKDTSVVSSADSHVDNEVASSKAADRLRNEFGFSGELVELFTNCGIAETLFSLKREGFAIHKGDPLLLIGVDMSNPNSIHYFNNGNYGLPAAAGGALGWPGGNTVDANGAAAMPEGVVAGAPEALGRFLATRPGVTDVSGGRLNVFYVNNLQNLHELPVAVQAQQQFRRVGPGLAAVTGIPIEQPLVRFVTLDRMTGPPQIYSQFNQTF